MLMNNAESLRQFQFRVALGQPWGSPGWVTAYVLGYVATLLAWIALAHESHFIFAMGIGAVRLIRGLGDEGNLTSR